MSPAGGDATHPPEVMRPTDVMPPTDVDLTYGGGCHATECLADLFVFSAAAAQGWIRGGLGLHAGSHHRPQVFANTHDRT